MGPLPGAVEHFDRDMSRKDEILGIMGESPSVELGLLSSSMTIAQKDSIYGPDGDQSEHAMLPSSHSVHKLREQIEHMPSNRRMPSALGHSRSVPESKLPKSKSYSHFPKPEPHKFPVSINKAAKRINWRLEGTKLAQAQTSDGNFLQLSFGASTIDPNASVEEHVMEQELADQDESEIERQYILKRLYYEAVQSPPGITYIHTQIYVCTNVCVCVCVCVQRLYCDAVQSLPGHTHTHTHTHTYSYWYVHECMCGCN
jgi:hypothetical protein